MYVESIASPSLASHHQTYVLHTLTPVVTIIIPHFSCTASQPANRIISSAAQQLSRFTNHWAHAFHILLYDNWEAKSGQPLWYPKNAQQVSKMVLAKKTVGSQIGIHIFFGCFFGNRTDIFGYASQTLFFCGSYTFWGPN